MRARVPFADITSNQNIPVISKYSLAPDLPATKIKVSCVLKKPEVQRRLEVSEPDLTPDLLKAQIQISNDRKKSNSSLDVL